MVSLSMPLMFCPRLFIFISNHISCSFSTSDFLTDVGETLCNLIEKMTGIEPEMDSTLGEFKLFPVYIARTHNRC